MKAKDMNRDQLRKAAGERAIPGRSKMNAEELRKSVRAAQQSAPTPLTNTQRADNYRAQNGSAKLTPAQMRRVMKGTHRAS